MLFPLFTSRFLLFLGVFSLFSLPSFADNPLVSSQQIAQKGKAKKGDNPPRPKPKPGPREGGDDD